MLKEQKSCPWTTSKKSKFHDICSIFRIPETLEAQAKAMLAQNEKSAATFFDLDRQVVSEGNINVCVNNFRMRICWNPKIRMQI